jgi:hypothetical protein
MLSHASDLMLLSCFFQLRDILAAMEAGSRITMPPGLSHRLYGVIATEVGGWMGGWVDGWRPDCKGGGWVHGLSGGLVGNVLS